MSLISAIASRKTEMLPIRPGNWQDGAAGQSSRETERTVRCTQVAKSGVLTMGDLSRRPIDRCRVSSVGGEPADLVETLSCWRQFVA